MYVIRFDSSGFRERFTGEYERNEDILLPENMTESCTAVTVRMKKGMETKEHVHTDEEQVYVILSGEGKLSIEGEEKIVSGGMLAYIPRNSKHRIVATGKGELVYIYIAIWPEGKPEERQDSSNR